jgi:nucleoside-diphosphate-sugar epimerase
MQNMLFGALRPERPWQFWNPRMLESAFHHHWLGAMRPPSISQCVRTSVDIIILNIALGLSFLLRYCWWMIYDLDNINGLQPNDLARHFITMYLDVFWVVTIIGIVTFWLSGVYTYARTYPVRYKVVVVTEAITFAFVLAGLAVFVTAQEMWLPRSVWLMAWLIALALFVASRLWSAIWRHLIQYEAPVRSAAFRDIQYEAPGQSAVPREKTVLVIGGAGYIGSALLPKLIDEGYRVRVLDLFLYGTGPIAAVLDNSRVETIRADFRQVDALVRTMRGVDHLVHLGGIVGDPACAIDEELTIDVNLAATRLIGEVAKGHGIKHFVFASTCSVYGASDDVLTEQSKLSPLSLYARSKMASEKVLLEMADDTFTPIIVRFGTIYGLSGRTRFDLVVNLLAAKAAFDGRITVFGGDQWRPFLHVDDAALAVAKLLHLPPGRGAEVFNVGSNRENYTIAQVGEIVRRIVPEAELILERCDRDRRNYRVAFSKIQMMVGFEPCWTIEAGVRQVVAAIRAGEILDYQEVRYSNEKYLNETHGFGLARPQIQWAYDLIREAPMPVPIEERMG